jgi:dephospho-CoA kinase
MAKLVIATVAEKGAGKGLFVELLKKLLPRKRIVSVRFSDPIREILEILGKEITRENTQILATAIRKGFDDEGVFAPVLQKRIQAIDADVIVLDGLRKAEEVPYVRELGGILVSVSASPEVRYQRIKDRGENTGEQGMSWEQFLREEGGAPEIAIRTIGETMADATIENNGTVEEFEKKIQGFLNQYVLPKL